MMPLLILNLFLAGQLHTDHDHPTYPEILQGLRDVESLVESFSLSNHIDVIQNDRESTWVKSLDADYTADSKGRILYEAVQQIQKGGSIVSVEKLRSSFDGLKLMGLQGDKTQYFSGRLSSTPSIPWLVDPREFFLKFQAKPISDLLKAKGGHIVGTSLWEGRPVVVLETKINELKWDRRTCRLLVDCGRNFAVVRKSIRSQPLEGEGKDWFDYLTIEGSGYLEIKGVWVPTKVKKEEYTVSKNASPQLLRRYLVDNSKWQINQPVTDTLFKTKFPVNVYVNDEINGRQYKAIEITDQALLDQTSQAESLLLPTHISKSSRSLSKALIAILSLAALGLITTAIILRKKARRGVSK